MNSYIQEKSAGLDNVSDSELLTLIQKNDDQRAFAVLMDRYKDKVTALAYRLMYNSDVAEDAAQDVFCTVWRNRDKWDVNGSAQFSTWIYRVTVNRCVDLKRKQRPQLDIQEMELAHDDNVDQTMRQTQLADALGLLLEELPTNQSLALKAYYLEEKSISDIALDMDKSELSVRSMIKRGKAGLRDHKDMLRSY